MPCARSSIALPKVVSEGVEKRVFVILNNTAPTIENCAPATIAIPEAHRTVLSELMKGLPTMSRSMLPPSQHMQRARRATTWPMWQQIWTT
jgi:hypothetical protein